MLEDLRFRFTLIVLVVLAACYLLYPTYKYYYSINEDDLSLYSDSSLKELKNNALKLGLDLQGGMYVVLEADVPALLIKLSNKYSEELENIINISNNLSKTNQTNFFDEFEAIIHNDNISLVRYYSNLADGRRDNKIIIKELKKRKEEAINTVLEIIRNRIDEFGVSEPNIQRYGQNRIIVELAGITDSDRARNLIQKTASMEFLLVLSNEKLNNTLDKIDNFLIDSKYKIQKNIEPKLSKKNSTNEIDDIFSNSDHLDLVDYSTNPEALKKNPFSAYIRLFSFGIGISSNEIKNVVAILDNPEVKKIIPRDSKFIWGNKIEKSQTESGALFNYKLLYYVKIPPVISGGMIKNPEASIASVGSELSGQWVVNLGMTKEGTRKWSRFTGANKNKQIAIVLDEKVYMAPFIRDKIPSGRTQISGFTDVNESKDIANVLRAGELPAPVNIMQERTIGPSLGKDSINSGKKAMLIGIGLVMLFMLIYYRGAGLLANFAMLLNLIIVMAILAAVGASLTLPGIAGLILTIGMSVDANVIIFERIREELNLGKAIKSAIYSGYERAFLTILDANLTTLIAAFVLAWIGSGPIKGFAITLSAGILCSMFTAVFVTRTIFLLLVDINLFKKMSI